MEVGSAGDRRRRVPRTDLVLDDPALTGAVERLGRAQVRELVRAVLDSCRHGGVEPEDVVAEVVRLLPPGPTRLQRVLNATGVIVHTNLGRAPLSAAARQALGLAAGATDVELDVATGRRGRRGGHVVDALLAAVPSAEQAHVVNNGAAALALVASTLSAEREIVIARGELVEIGDGFRIPELLESAGARIREVGTTNRVTLDDYRAALGPDTGIVLKVHPSNFVVSGFTSSVDVKDLALLGVTVVADLGSGLLHPHPRLPDEPDATTTLKAGADLVTASGDKLLGGPQCGLLLGRAGLVQRLRRHPLARAFRVDKLTLAALEATVTGPPPPVHRMLAANVDDLTDRAQRLVETLGDVVDVQVVATDAAVGGGGAPGVRLESVGISLPPTLSERLRRGSPPVLGRVWRDRLVLDLLTVAPEEDDPLADCVRRAAKDD